MKTGERLLVLLALVVALVSLVALAIPGASGAVSPMPASKQQRESIGMAKQAPASAAVSPPMISRELVESGMGQVRVTDIVDAPIRGAQVTDGLPLAGGGALLAQTADDGTAEVAVPATGTVVAYCDGFSPATAEVKEGCVTRIRMTPSVPLRVRCTDEAGRPVRGVRVRAQLLDTDRWAQYAPWDRRTSYEGLTSDEGSLTFRVAPGRYFIEPTFLVGQCLAKSNLLPEMCATAPGVDALLTVGEVLAAVVTAPGDIIAWAAMRYEGVVPVGSWADDGCAVVRSALRERFPGALVFAMMSNADRQQPPRLLLRVYCKECGWCEAMVELTALAVVQPHAMCVATGRGAGAGEITIECYQPSGQRIDYGDLDFSLRDGPEPRSTIFANLRRGRAQEVPPGVWWLRSSSKAISGLVGPIKIQIADGTKMSVRCDLVREVEQIRLRLRVAGKEIEQGHFLVSFRDGGGWIASNVLVQCSPGIVVAPRGEITLRVARLGCSQADKVVTVGPAPLETVTFDLNPVPDVR